MSKLFVDAKCYSLSNKAIKCIGKVLITRDINGRSKVTQENVTLIRFTEKIKVK